MMVHRIPPNCLALREDDAKTALDAFRQRVQLTRWKIAEILEPFIGEHSFHERRAVREAASNHLDDLLADLCGDLETNLSNAVIEAEDAIAEQEAADLRRSVPVRISDG